MFDSNVIVIYCSTVFADNVYIFMLLLLYSVISFCYEGYMRLTLDFCTKVMYVDLFYFVKNSNTYINVPFMLLN